MKTETYSQNIQHKNYQRLDHRYFKAFMPAAETENFTLAAEMACMTQSGVSQHIAKLEKQLGVPLFKRTGKNVILTTAGQKLVKHVKRYLAFVDDLFADVHDKHESMEGVVSYAMPPSCILSPHFPMLLERRKHYPELDLRVRLVPNNDIYKFTIQAKIDFGFITEKIANPLLSYTPICKEEYVLVSSDKTLCGKGISKNLLFEKFISYPGSDAYINLWMKHFLPSEPNMDYRSINITSNINTIEGAITMACGGLGVAAFPRHCVQAYIDKGQLFEFCSDTIEPLLNEIYIVKIADYDLPYRVKTIIQWFKLLTPTM